MFFSYHNIWQMSACDFAFHFTFVCAWWIFSCFERFEQQFFFTSFSLPGGRQNFYISECRQSHTISPCIIQYLNLNRSNNACRKLLHIKGIAQMHTLTSYTYILQTQFRAMPTQLQISAPTIKRLFWRCLFYIWKLPFSFFIFHHCLLMWRGKCEILQLATCDQQTSNFHLFKITFDFYSTSIYRN